MFISKLVNRFSLYWSSHKNHKFYAWLEQYFGNSANSTSKDSIILCELNSMQPSHIVYAYLTDALSKKFNASLYAYYTHVNLGFFKRFFLKLDEFFGTPYHRAYKSFGAKKFLAKKDTLESRKKAKKYYEKIHREVTTKKDVEDIHINGIYVGDLIYDSFLRDFALPTLDPESPAFKKFIFDVCKYFAYWEQIFETYDVKAVNVSHCVYLLAVPLRIAVNRNIDVYQSGINHIYYLTDKNLFAYNEFKYYSENFKELTNVQKSNALRYAKDRIDLRFSGEVGVDMSYSTKSAFTNKRYQRLISESKNIKILIATHCFIDSPHSYGNNLFTDFYEWIDYLGKVSEKTNYDWYIKTHPDFFDITMETVIGFSEKYPKFKILPSDASHNQIIEEGINFVLTTYGTIGFEYAAKGIKVINASLNNPHISYNFNIHPRSIEEYYKTLMNLNSVNLEINLSDIYEFYYMKNLYNSDNIFFDDYKKTEGLIGGYKELFTSQIYYAWLNEFSEEKHEKIIKILANFIESKDFSLNLKHMEISK